MQLSSGATRMASAAKNAVQGMSNSRAIMPRNIQRRRFTVTTAAYDTDLSTRTFTDYSVYKGKAAVSFKPIPPTYNSQKYNSPNSGDYLGYVVDREGVLLLELANVLPNQGGQTGYGNRNYDWQNKVTFALKAIELAQLTDFDVAGDQAKGVEFFHDPNKGSNDPNAVKTTKTLKLNANQSGDGYMLSVSQKSGMQSSYVAVPISRPEYVVLKHLAAYCIPRLYGFDMLFEGQGTVPGHVNSK